MGRVKAYVVERRTWVDSREAHVAVVHLIASSSWDAYAKAQQRLEGWMRHRICTGALTRQETTVREDVE